MLDIGTHRGDLLMHLGDRIAPSVGVDDSLCCDAECGRHSLLTGRFPQRTPAGPFDAATLLAVVEHLNPVSLEDVADGLLSVVVPGGVVVVTMPSPSADGVLRLLRRAHVIDGIDLEAHRGTRVEQLTHSWCARGLVLRSRRRFEFGFNNLLVFEVPPKSGAEPSEAL